MAEDAAVNTAGATFGYTTDQLEAMPVWEVGVRLGLVDGSDGYPLRAGKVVTKAEAEAMREAAEEARQGGPRGRRKGHGRLDPQRAKPRLDDKGRMVDTGRVFFGDDAR